MRAVFVGRSYFVSYLNLLIIYSVFVFYDQNIGLLMSLHFNCCFTLFVNLVLVLC